MTDLVLTGAEPRAPAAPLSAAELAARIPVPARLPERHDGELLRHLSPSSYSLWVSCPEAWRRRYIKGEKPPPSGAMFLGSRVDDALSAYHRRILEHGDRLALDQLLDLYREQWRAELDVEREKQGIEWDEDLPERAAFDIGRQAVELAMAELVPQLGDPVDVQRRLEFTLAPGLEWTVLCYLDLETLKDGGAEPAPTVVDLKVKSAADRRGQSELGPAGRPLPRRALAGGLSGARAAVRADRQARHMSISTYASLCCCGNYVAARVRGRAVGAELADIGSPAQTRDGAGHCAYRTSGGQATAAATRSERKPRPLGASALPGSSIP